MTFQTIFFALIAAGVLFMLYNVLGKKVGRQPQEDARALPPAEANTPQRPPLDASVLAATSSLRARDPGFDPAKFLDGARQAYETIVRGYAAGDRTALGPLLSAGVMASFEAGMAARETRGETEQVEFTQPPRADLESASAEGERAVARVRFLAEIRSRITEANAAEGAEPRVEERRTAENWTFERTLGAADPNWVLARVEAATA
jgi:predicted lipid-binding transport protein (Tim44 family)